MIPRQTSSLLIIPIILSMTACDKAFWFGTTAENERDKHTTAIDSRNEVKQEIGGEKKGAIEGLLDDALIQKKDPEGTTGPTMHRKKYFDLKEVRSMTGTYGRPTYFIYEDTVYDASESALWDLGMHIPTGLKAGYDITYEINQLSEKDKTLFFENIPVAGFIRTS